MFGSPETTPGGRALKFYSSVRLDIRRIESIKDGVEVVGNRTRVKVVKNKVAPPFRQAEFDIMYGKGISREGSLLDIGVDLGIVKKSGAWYTYEGEQLGQGRENAKQFLAENPEIMVEISERVRQQVGIGDDARRRRRAQRARRVQRRRRRAHHPRRSRHVGRAGPRPARLGPAHVSTHFPRSRTWTEGVPCVSCYPASPPASCSASRCRGRTTSHSGETKCDEWYDGMRVVNPPTNRPPRWPPCSWPGHCGQSCRRPRSCSSRPAGGPTRPTSGPTCRSCRPTAHRGLGQPRAAAARRRGALALEPGGRPRHQAGEVRPAPDCPGTGSSTSRPGADRAAHRGRRARRGATRPRRPAGRRRSGRYRIAVDPATLDRP